MTNESYKYEHTTNAKDQSALSAGLGSSGSSSQSQSDSVPASLHIDVLSSLPVASSLSLRHGSRMTTVSSVVVAGSPSVLSAELGSSDSSSQSQSVCVPTSCNIDVMSSPSVASSLSLRHGSQIATVSSVVVARSPFGVVESIR